MSISFLLFFCGGGWKLAGECDILILNDTKGGRHAPTHMLFWEADTMKRKERKARFKHPLPEDRAIFYVTLPAPDSADLEDAVREAIKDCRTGGFSTVIPQWPLGTQIELSTLRTVRTMYETLLFEAEKQGLFVGFYLDPAYEALVVKNALAEGDADGLCGEIITCKEYMCEEEVPVDRVLQAGKTLSLVAFSEERAKIIDLRPNVVEGRLTFTPPKGNYIIQHYTATKDEKRAGANYLSHTASLSYLTRVFALFADIFTPHLGHTLSTLAYSGIGFNAENRRNWRHDFNDLFEKRFGIDPAPLYPALFGYIGPDTSHVKAMFMTLRALLLQNGIMRAIHDFCREYGLIPFGNLSEPKLTACSFTAGDTMQSNAFSPCALFDKSYMYGTNSVKIAAGAAYNNDHSTVNAELFRNYRQHDRNSLYKDAMNAFARGANRTGLHLPRELLKNAALGNFVARVQSLLGGGTHVADIAMLYPIYHLHSQLSLYFSPVTGYEYPVTPANTDYMTLINSISNYVGYDLTLLHPETLNTRCHTEGGVLYLDNQKHPERFRIMVLPATRMISLGNLRLLKRFFDEGGKLVATGLLPSMAFERDSDGANDREVQRIITRIFGADACNPSIMRNYCYNKNDAGGEAIFLYFNSSAIDGTMMTRSSTVNEALEAFGLPFDVYLPGMPRLEGTGGFNAIYPEFSTIGLHRSIPGGGMLNYIHKHHEDCDVYYFSNTSNEAYRHHVLLRGAFEVEEWNPHNGTCRARTCGFLSYRGEIYTTLRLTLDSCASTFFYATPAETEGKKVTEITSIDHLRSEHAALMSEF